MKWLGLAILCLAVANCAAKGASRTTEELAQRYAPRLRFDAEAGNPYCFPSNANDYYNARMGGDTQRICNVDYSSMTNATVPTYWHAQICGYHMHIAYWSFFGYQHDCNCCKGQRDAWWVSLVVKIRDYDLDERLHEVRYSQRDGWYTRVPGMYEVANQTHPVAYMGKTSHGAYHDDGGTGTCCYYEDFRDPNEADQHLDTWHNLKEMDGSEAWMADSQTAVWNDIYSPPFRGDWDLCYLNGCTGANVWLCGTSGCHKSNIGDAPF